jgi:hypothetical protein
MLLPRSRVSWAVVAGLALLLAAALAAPAQARVAFGTGVAEVRGERVLVEVFVTVPGTASAASTLRRALAEQGAKPGVAVPDHAFNGLRWGTPVAQYYNPDEEPVDAFDALRETHRQWSSVRDSAFRMDGAGITTRCPSLTRGCGTFQSYDGYSDVGWQRLSRGTLGVTWFHPSRQEADVALTTRYAWALGCQSVATGAYDVQTVLLHENGHVAGLDHSEDGAAVMYPSYQGARCALADDDVAGLRALYPAG